MRCTFVLLALVAFATAIPPPIKQRAADQETLKKQQDVIALLHHVTGKIPNEQLQALGLNYDIENNIHNYANPTVVKYYVGAVKAGLVQPKGTPYSGSPNLLRKEVVLLSQVLGGAKDYQTFLSTACWAHVHVNEEQFAKAFIGSVLNRADTQGIVLPPTYEIFPQHYFDARIIQEAQDISSEGIQNFVIPVNHSAHLPHGEHQVAYFTQDIGLASYYGYVNLAGYNVEQGQQHGYQQPSVGQYKQQSVQEQKESIGHGSEYYYLHQQILAHYELNRLSNGLGPVPDLDIENVQAPYQPHVRHLNGLEFPGRPENLVHPPQKQKLVHLVHTLLQRLFQAIDAGHVTTPQGAFLSLYHPQGLNILGDLIEGTGRSVNPRYYGSLQIAARELLGNTPVVQNIYEYTPSVLEVGTTAVRDPAFYQLYQQILHLFQHYQASLPPHQYSDLLLPGVAIQDVDISQLVTVFSDYYVNLDAVTSQHHQQQQEQHIKAQVKRLDHKPYQYQVTVQSEQSVPGAVVRVYLGPKHDYQGKPISISHHRHQFVELDQFIHDLQQGQNVIVRHSQQAPGKSHDHPSIDEILQHVDNAVRSQEPLYISEPHQIFGFPARLSLPKGQEHGFPFQLLVVISGPNQQQVSYGPIIPEDIQTYQFPSYQIINHEEFQSKQQQEVPHLAGVQQSVEVLPENLVAAEQSIEAVRTHYADIYAKHQGHYPYAEIHAPIGEGVQPQQVHGEHVQHGQQYVQQVHPQYPQQHGQQHGQQYHQYGQQAQQQQQQPQQQQVPQEQQYVGQQQYQYQPQQQVYHGQPQKPQQYPGQQVNYQQQQQQYQIPQQQPVVKGVYGVKGVQVGAPVQGFQGTYSTPEGQFVGEGQQHAGGYQGIYAQGQIAQDQSVSEYYRGKHISHVLGGAISLDGKPLGYPLDRPHSVGALSVPNIYVKDVLVYHEQPPHHPSW